MNTRNNKKTLEDVMICPYCNKDNDTYIIETDEIEFNYNGEGYYHVDCKCGNCGIYFRLYTKFEYNIIKSYAK